MIHKWTCINNMFINKSGHIGGNSDSKITKKWSKTCCHILFLCKIEWKRNFEHFLLVLLHCAAADSLPALLLASSHLWRHAVPRRLALCTLDLSLQSIKHLLFNQHIVNWFTSHGALILTATTSPKVSLTHIWGVSRQLSQRAAREP